MPRFLVYAPDHPDYLQHRLAVREEHLARGKLDTERGIVCKSCIPIHATLTETVYSGPLLPRPGTQARDAVLPQGTPNIAGSFMVYQMDTLEHVWDRLTEDVYWRAGVWDKDRLFVDELLG